MSDSPSQFSHFPAPPPPLRVRLVTLPEHECPYRPGRVATSRAMLASQMSPEVYHRFMDANFRRSGRLIYQPVCVGCRMCQAIRLRVDAFRPNKSMRRCLTRNADMTVGIESPAPTQEKYQLYLKYQTQWHESHTDTDWNAFVEFLYDSPVRTIEFVYRDRQGVLQAVGICDVSADSLSSVYFYFNPEAQQRGLGTLGVLKEVEYARSLGIAYYYLGYWVADCKAMRYKANFQPSELLQTDGTWRVSRSVDESVSG
jgi:leucyl-tRNA---protein transferase